MQDLNETVSAARKGCRAAFDDLVRATYDETYSHALRLVGNADDAHDVAQDTYLKAFRHLPGFRGDAHVGTWLYRITANCAHNLLDRRRKHRTEQLSTEHAVVDENHDPVERFDNAALRGRLVEALAALPEKLRAVIVLRDIYDQSHEMIAEQLGITETAAKVRLHRARKKLREDMFGAESSTTERPDQPEHSDAETSGAA